MKLLFISTILIILLPIVLASSNECDWEINILLDKYTFENGKDFNFTVNVFRNSGEKTQVSAAGYIKDLLSDWERNYTPWKNETISNYRNEKYTPNLEEDKFYLVFFNITELNCNDTNLKNNFDYKFIMILPISLIQDYSKLKINEFLSNPKGYDDASMPDGEWVELYNSGDSSLDVKGLTINDDYGNGLKISDTNVINNNTLIQPNSYLTIYRNEAGVLELNNDFDIVKLFYKNILLDEVSYSHTKEGLSWSKVDDKWVLTFPTPDNENYATEPDYNSYIKIDRAYLGDNDKAKFGDSLRVRITVYKGDTSKYNLDLYLVDESNNQVSKRSEINLEDMFTNYTLIVPLQIEPNCNAKYNNGTYTIILKGLDEIDKEEIEIEGITKSLCEEIKIKEKTSSESIKSSQVTSTKTSINNTSMTPITSSVVYTSSDIKARNIGIYFFCAVLLILIIYLIFGKSL